MANEAHLEILKKGVAVWNKWRKENPSITPDLSKADLSKRDLQNANLSEADLTKTHLTDANLIDANLRGANLGEAFLLSANLSGANLKKAKLTGANLAFTWCFETDFGGQNLSGVNFQGAYLHEANLSNANLSNANLSYANLTNAILNGATLTGCRVFGISAWGLAGLEKAEQSDLVITPENEPKITVDNLEVAHFIYILLHSEKIRKVIDTITSKVVLILGRFTPKRKEVLDAIREELRKRDYIPVLFDFVEPESRDPTETIETLARMSRFIIADITDAATVREELRGIVPDLPSIPVQPILLSSAEEYFFFRHVKRYHWVLKTYRYNDKGDLLRNLEEKVIVPAEAEAKKRQRK